MGEQRRKKEFQAASAKPENTGHRLWVIAVLAFWFCVAITLAVTLFTGKLDLVLVSITLGAMVLGVWLKARYQIQQRKAH